MISCWWKKMGNRARRLWTYLPYDTRGSCIPPRDYRTFFQSVFSNFKPFLQFTIFSLLNSWPLIFALKKERAGRPPTDRPSEAGVRHVLLSAPLFWYEPPHIRLFFFLIIFPFMLCESQQRDRRIKMLTAATARSCVVSNFETDCWLAIWFVL